MVRQLERPLDRRSCGHDLGYEADPERLRGVDALTQQGELLRARGAEEPDEPVGAARARQDAERDLG